MKAISFAFLAGLVGVSEAASTRDHHIHFNPISSVASDSLHNIHIEYGSIPFTGELQMIFGDCHLTKKRDLHHFIGRTEVTTGSKPKKFVWIVPEDARSGDCLHAFSGNELVGRSEPITVRLPVKKRQSIADVADISGPWFDGVAYMKSRNNSDAFVSAAKNKTVAIVGGGMAGLLTSLLLQSVGITNWKIIESSHRVGGRIRTKYLNNTTRDDYQYQEMGPMRFPVSITYPGLGTLDIQDHKMVFQLGDTLNKLNKNNTDLLVKFIPWIQSSPNTPSGTSARLPDGRIPSSAQVAADPSLAGLSSTPPNVTEAQAANRALEAFLGISIEKIAAVATNVYQAHKKALQDGLLDWSEANYLRYALGVSLNTTDYLTAMTNTPMWADIYETAYFLAKEWKTIDKGLESLPRAFVPLIKNKVTYNRKVSGLAYNNATGKIAVNWRDEQDKYSLKPKSEEFDYAVVAVPFTRVRLWRMPRYSSSLSRAINNMNYATSCKVALHYKTRFWEHLDPPIIGGCGFVDIPGIQSVCYPSYEINSTRPGVILASYNFYTNADATASLSTDDHVALAQRAMIEAHGPIAAEQFTGAYERQCWGTDEHIGGGWANPYVGQQKLYIPAFYQTEFKTIFVGEHTSYTHSWIFSALDSAVRGSVQLCLELGLVDEAKQIVREWMGRWIRV